MTDAAQFAFRGLLAELQRLFAAEGSAAGDLTADIIGAALRDETAIPTGQDPGHGEWLLTLDPDLPLGETLRAASPLIPWFHAGLDDGRIAEAVARRMLTAELIGPDAPIFNDQIRAGLFWQGPQIDYPVRTHAAEECFVMLSGKGDWARGMQGFGPGLPGDYIFHPSMEPHRSRSHDGAFLAAWRWSGDIGWTSYHCENGTVVPHAS